MRPLSSGGSSMRPGHRPMALDGHAADVCVTPTALPRKKGMTALLSMSPALALAQERAVTNPAVATVARTRIVTSVLGTLIDEHEMLDSTAVSRVLGKATTSRNTASRLAATGTVIALPAGGHKLYPAFQFDAERRRVRPIVAEINTARDSSRN